MLVQYGLTGGGSGAGVGFRNVVDSRSILVSNNIFAFVYLPADGPQGPKYVVVC
jgi:hypothetical protein